MTTDSAAKAYTTETRIEIGTEAQPLLVRWSASGSYGETADVQRHCYALMTSEGTVLIDPNEAAPMDRARWEALVLPGGRRPVAMVLTSSWHERSSYLLREQYGIPVWLPAAGTADMEGTPDHLYGEGTALPGGLRAIAIAPVAGGDTVLCWRTASGERVLFAGDALLGGSRRAGHWREAPGMYVWLPPEAHAGVSEAELRARFARLLSEEIDLICSAHGWPVPFRDNAAGELWRLVETGAAVEQGLRPRS